VKNEDCAKYFCNFFALTKSILVNFPEQK